MVRKYAWNHVQRWSRCQRINFVFFDSRSWKNLRAFSIVLVHVSHDEMLSKMCVPMMSGFSTWAFCHLNKDEVGVSTNWEQVSADLRWGSYCSFITTVPLKFGSLSSCHSCYFGHLLFADLLIERWKILHIRGWLILAALMWILPFCQGSVTLCVWHSGVVMPWCSFAGC